MLLMYTVIFSFSCFLLNMSSLLEEYILLSRGYNPMDLSNMVHPENNSPTTGGAGGSGGPANTPPVAPVQDNRDETDNQPTFSVTLPNQIDYEAFGKGLKDKVDVIIAEREASLAANPYNIRGRRTRISEAISISQLKLDKQD